MVRDSEQLVAMAYTTWLSRQGSGEREWAVSGNAIDHLAIMAGPGSGERQWAVSGNALDHLAITAGPGSGERESEQLVAMP